MEDLKEMVKKNIGVANCNFNVMLTGIVKAKTVFAMIMNIATINYIFFLRPPPIYLDLNDQLPVLEFMSTN